MEQNGLRRVLISELMDLVFDQAGPSTPDRPPRLPAISATRGRQAILIRAEHPDQGARGVDALA